MRTRNRTRSQRSIFALAGWLFADLLLVLSMLFLANSAAWAKVNPPPPPPQICGMEQTAATLTLVAPNPFGLRAQTSSALNSFATVVKRSSLSKNSGRIAAFVEVFGGSTISPSDGSNFASGAIRALKLLANQHFIFTSQTAYFKPLWDGTLRDSQVTIYVFFFHLSASCAVRS